MVSSKTTFAATSAVLSVVFFLHAVTFRSAFHKRSPHDYVITEVAPLKTVASHVTPKRKVEDTRTNGISRSTNTKSTIKMSEKKNPDVKRRSDRAQRKGNEIQTVERSESYPATCPCEKVNPKKNAVCFFYTHEPQCESRGCKPSFACVSNYTGLTCYRKKQFKAVVPDDHHKGMCRKKAVNKYIYVPYSDGL